MAHPPRFHPYPVSKEREQKQSTNDTDPSEQLFEAQQRCLHRYFTVKLLNRNMRSPFSDVIHIATQQSQIILLQITHPTPQDRRSQRCCNTGTNKAQHAKSLKKVLKRHTFSHIDRQRHIQDSVSDSPQKIGQIEAFDIQIGVYQEIEAILIDHQQQKAEINQKLISLSQYSLPIKDSCRPDQNPDKNAPIDGDSVQLVVTQDRFHEHLLQNGRGGQK